MYLEAFAHVLADVGEEGDDVVAGLLLDLEHPRHVEGGLFLDLGQRLGRNQPTLGPGLADGDLHLEPGGHAALVAPDGAHFRA